MEIEVAKEIARQEEKAHELQGGSSLRRRPVDMNEAAAARVWKMRSRPALSAQSLINNLKSIADNRFGAQDAVESLARMKRQTGLSEKKLLTEMVIYAFEHDPMYETARSMLTGEKSRYAIAYECLSILRELRGQSKQSLLASAVNSSASDPAFMSAVTNHKNHTQ